TRWRRHGRPRSADRGCTAPPTSRPGTRARNPGRRSPGPGRKTPPGGPGPPGRRCESVLWAWRPPLRMAKSGPRNRRGPDIFAVWSRSALDDELVAALGTGDLDLALPRRHPADGLAVLAGEIAVLLVRPAGLGPGGPALQGQPPAQKPLVLRPALAQVPGEGPPQDQNRQNRHQQALEGVEESNVRQGDDDAPHQPQDQVEHQQGDVQLVGAVSAVHEPGQGVLYPVEKVAHGERTSLPQSFSS